MDKIAIVGSREYPDEAEVRAFVRSLPLETVVVSGGCKRGVDTWAADEARKRGMVVEEYLPNYELLGTFAPKARNTTIVKNSTRMQAFWNGYSGGTYDAIIKALNAKIPVNVQVKLTGSPIG